MDTKDSLMEELANVRECLEKALAWWHDEARHLTEWRGDETSGDEYNVFDEPGWVKEAKKALADEDPAIEVPSNTIFLRAGPVVLTRGDVALLDNSKSHPIRLSIEHDAIVKELYDIWKKR